MLTRIGLRKTSLIDFPGRVASVLFAPGCDFACPYCQNAPLAGRGPWPEDLLDLEEALGIVEARKGLVSGVVLSGGEPLLHQELPGIASRLRASGFALKLDTNGSHPGRIEAVGADYIALDLKTAPSRYSLVAPGQAGAGEALLASLRIVRESGAAYELRMTLAPGIVSPDDLEELLDILDPRDEVVLQAFRPGGCLDPAWDLLEPWPEEAVTAFLGGLRRVAPRSRLRGGLGAMAGLG